jgi:hypothetical protein
MTTFPLGNESDPVRVAILAAMNRLITGAPQRSNGRLNITQLAVEAGVKRWYLTHQHTDLRDLFQGEATRAEGRYSAQIRSADAFDELKSRHAKLQRHCRLLESRLQIYATALNLLALENAALSGRDADAAKVRALPRRRDGLP